jgi:hypothetical protein
VTSSVGVRDELRAMGSKSKCERTIASIEGCDPVRLCISSLAATKCRVSMVESAKADPEGFEPSTAGLGGRCPILTRLRVLMCGFQCRVLSLWGRADSNCRPSVPNARGWTKLPYYPDGNWYGTSDNKKLPRTGAELDKPRGSFCLRRYWGGPKTWWLAPSRT